MKGFILATFAVTLMICHVYALYSHKCKEAETSNDKLVRFIENANCTIFEGKRRFREGLNHFHLMFKQGMNRVHNKVTNMMPSVNMSGNVPVNMPGNVPVNMPGNVPVKMPGNVPVNMPGNVPVNMPVNMPGNVPVSIPVRVPENTSGNKAETPGEPPVKTTVNSQFILTPSPALDDEYKGLDHPIDIRMLQDNDTPTSRKKRDDDEDLADDREGDDEATTQKPAEQNLFFAPDKCRANQRFVDGRCRTIFK